MGEVIVYKSDDESAPQIDNVQGSLIPILKCLKDGYGVGDAAVPGGPWDYEVSPDGLQIALWSTDPEATGHVLVVDDSDHPDYDAGIARVRGVKSHGWNGFDANSDPQWDTDKLFPTLAQSADGASWVKADSATDRPWRLHASASWFWFFGPGRFSDQVFWPAFFGDAPTGWGELSVLIAAGLKSYQFGGFNQGGARGDRGAFGFFKGSLVGGEDPQGYIGTDGTPGSLPITAGQFDAAINALWSADVTPGWRMYGRGGYDYPVPDVPGGALFAPVSMAGLPETTYGVVTHLPGALIPCHNQAFGKGESLGSLQGSGQEWEVLFHSGRNNSNNRITGQVAYRVK